MKSTGALRSRLAIALLSALVVAPSPTIAQSLDGVGVVPTGLLLRRLDGVKRVLMIGAHPDDEDTSLLATLARGEGVETAYLSLTRGDGGQNLIGPELWEGLGVIRTGELEGARALDGGRQFFTRAFDYGFSKSAEEALDLWPREELLHDVTWVVRRFRPHVIVSVFTGTPQDGHGQHQAAGIMAREVFEAAGDPTRFPEQLEAGVEAWAPAKLYQLRRRFGGGAVEGAMLLETGELDPLLGRSLFQLSMESRSQHRSQDMGAPQPLGPRTTGVELIASRVEDGDGGLFAGVDTTLVGAAAGLPPTVAAAAVPHLEAYRAAVRRAQERLGLDPGAVVPDLVAASEELVAARRIVGDDARSEIARAIERKQAVITRAIMAAAGIVFEVRATDDLVVPGQTVEIEALLWNGGRSTILTPGIQLVSSDGWQIQWKSMEGLADDGGVAPGTLARWTYDLVLPANASPTRLYFLEEERDGALYEWPARPGVWGLPRDPAPVEGAATFRLAAGAVESGSRVVASASWKYVGVDPAFGEFTKQVLVVPAVSVRVSPNGIVWPTSATAARSVSIVLRAEAEAGAAGEVRVEAPTGWIATPATQPFELGGAGVERTVTFEVRPSGAPAPGDHTLRVAAVGSDGRRYDEGYTLIDYDHVPRSPLYEDAQAAVTVVPVTVTEGLRVGYVMGSGDDGPEAIRQMGAQVEMLDEARVRAGAFEDFDAIVLGVRAYEVRPDVQAASAQLLDFARSGGTVVVQYNRGPLGALAPSMLEVGRGSPRVADETAPVTMLEPEAPVFTSPNRIGPADFEGWVQERGLYFAAEWDASWVPLLELNDPGEDPAHGSLLVAEIGDGVFVYTALSFFRQWSERVPGAYRLFANLISLDGDAWRRFATER
jgi:LmbE family N-acetylglucosaminyl deacetylase